MVEDVLRMGSSTKDQQQSPKNDEGDGLTDAFSGLSVHDATDKIELKDLVVRARDQMSAVEERVDLLRTESVVLTHAVKATFFGRPDFVPNEKGRMLPAHTDKFVNGTFINVFHDEIQAGATWAYIARCLEWLDLGVDKVSSNVILQEVSNVLDQTYSRTQSRLKRHFATGNGSKLFKRMSNLFDKAGNARIHMKLNAEERTRSDPLCHYLLQLCQSETTAAKAAVWLQKLGELYTSHPSERERLVGLEAECLDDLARVTGFVQDLASSTSVPTASHKKIKNFVTKSQELEAELAPIKMELDLRDYAAPIDNLLEPGMADKALATMEAYIEKKAGATLGYIYQALVEECIADLEDQCEQAKARTKQDDKVEHIPLPATQEPQEEPVTSQRRKEKTRPAQPLDNVAVNPPEEAQGPAQEPAQTLSGSATTMDVFAKIFRRSEARGSLSWASFEAAMTDVGFSVIGTYSSVYTFRPPESMAIRRPLTIHRPHDGQVEGVRLFILAGRLKRAYGWSEETFQAA